MKQNPSSTSPHNYRMPINRIPTLGFEREPFERAVTVGEGERGNYCRLCLTHTGSASFSLSPAADRIVLSTELPLGWRVRG